MLSLKSTFRPIKSCLPHKLITTRLIHTSLTQSRDIKPNTTPNNEKQKVVYKPPITIERKLPDPFKKRDQNRRYFIVYAIAITLSCIFIFNYEKSSSPIVNSILYFLRRSQLGNEVLGSNIEFANNWPWIWGKLNTVQGIIDIKFKVKGSNNQIGWIKLNATRQSKMHPFEIHKFILEIDTNDSKVEYNLMDDPEFEFDL
ncbi:uncharacterized protein KGF55_001161 [Candida pseudojiufengensis]|uniref:uncharacterized protein n=1 Tax=Candida pseudojiufengensis TaxID=497109 RepID=UPI00222463C7|nr:uncharacterized protein KGF55_001161 [Candida pseudojiufengensis]KAI5965798.1 hypothetical protein KGF55_001161 [Candida pseudojiufengensis]